MTKKELRRLRPGERCWLERGIFVRMTKTKGMQYCISYKHDGRVIRETVGPKKTDARKSLAIRRAEIAQGRFQIPSKRRQPTFAVFSATYMEHAEQNKRSWIRDKGVLKIAKPFFGGKRIDEITSWDIERYKAQRAGVVTKATVNRDLALLKHMFNLAIDWGHLEANPVKRVKFFREEQQLMRILSPAEEVLLLEAAALHLKPIITVALHTGMRRGELLALRWDQVDLRNGIITIKHSKAGRVRHIPVNAVVRETLRQLKGRDGSVFRWEGKPIKRITNLVSNRPDAREDSTLPFSRPSPHLCEPDGHGGG